MTTRCVRAESELVTGDRTTPEAGAPIIRTGGLYKHYGNIRALEDVDLEVRPGVTGLIGANGAGKDHPHQARARSHPADLR